MLDILRQGAQSWGIKIVFGIIIAVFVLAFGMNRTSNDATTVLATVNDSPILIRDFQETYQRNLDTARRQNPSLTSEFLAQIKFKDQVLNQMITQELLLQKALDLGLTVSKEELASAIHLIPSFQNEGQTFDPEIYQSVLRANRLTPGQFESDFMKNLLMAKIQDYIGLPGTISEEQARDFYYYGRSTTSVSYLLYPWKAYEEEVNATADQISEYYAAHKGRFTVPAQAKISFLVLNPQTLADLAAVTDEEVAQFYDQHKETYKIEEQVHARHILIRLEENATAAEEETAMAKIKAAQDELATGQDFAQVAPMYTEELGSPGGDLGWLGRGHMLKPFEEAAFATATGAISDPVRTQYGLHLIKVEGKKEAGYEPLDDVKVEIRRSIAQDRALEALQDSVDHALELVVTGSDLQTVASSLGGNLVAQESEFFTQTDGPRDLQGLSPENTMALFELAPNATTHNPIQLADGYVLATKIEDKPTTTKTLDEVRDEIITDVTKDEAFKLAKAAADADLKSLLEGKGLANGNEPSLITTEALDRQGFVPELGMVPEMIEAAFVVEENSWLPSSYKVSEGYALARANAVTVPTAEDWDQEKELWLDSLNQRAQDQLVQTFLADLRAKAMVRIVNPKVLEN